MAPLVVFLRGVNVGSNKRFLPAALARDMAAFDVVNIGAVGTFVVRNAPSASALRSEIARRLPFEAEIVICPGNDLLALERGDPFAKRPAGKDVREMVTVLAKKPKKIPRLPIRRPDGADWQHELFRVEGRLALTFWRPDPRRLLYVDAGKELGVPGTTRTWKTIQKVCGILRE